MSLERMSEAVSNQSLGRIIRQCKEEGSERLVEMLERVREQFGSHFPLSFEAKKMINELRGNGGLTDENKARVFEKLTSGQGAPNTHMSGKFKGPEGRMIRQKKGSRYTNMSKRKKGSR